MNAMGRVDLGFSDYVVYVDESGDHSLTSIDAEFPVFALTFCVFRKVDYFASIVPAIEEFKFEFWGHDSVILHESDIRKQHGPFAFLRSGPEARAGFFDRLNSVMDTADFEIIASVIDKKRHLEKYSRPMNPYDVALLFCMERLLDLLVLRGQAGRRVHVVFEGRGKNEDRDLEVAFRRITANGDTWGYRQKTFGQIAFEPVIVTKAANSSGLQLADLTARPIALNVLRPEQQNRAYDTIEDRIINCKVFP